MKISKLLMICFVRILTQQNLYAQTSTLLHQGEIEFEKRINNYAILNEYYTNDYSKQFVNQFKASNHQIGITHYRLLFNDKYSLYSPTSTTATMPNVPLLTKLNTVYTDLIKRNSLAKKEVLSRDFLIEDTLRKIDWKITDETRDIAGYNCRRANALIMDSIYVVAFYTDQIVPKGGPESFTGLPGMILGLALPHEHITWFATRVINRDVLPSEWKLPEGKKRITNKELWNILIDDQTRKLNGKLGRLLSRNDMY